MNFKLWKKIFNPNFLSGLRSIMSILGKIANLIFGLSKVQYLTDEEIMNELIKEHNEQTIIAYYDEI